MKPYEKRVIDESLALSDNINKLSDFMHSDAFARMLPVDIGLLMCQLDHMQAYNDTLKRRIERFT